MQTVTPSCRVSHSSLVSVLHYSSISLQHWMDGEIEPPCVALCSWFHFYCLTICSERVTSLYIITHQANYNIPHVSLGHPDHWSVLSEDVICVWEDQVMWSWLQQVIVCGWRKYQLVIRAQRAGWVSSESSNWVRLGFVQGGEQITSRGEIVGPPYWQIKQINPFFILNPFPYHKIMKIQIPPSTQILNCTHNITPGLKRKEDAVEEEKSAQAVSACRSRLKCSLFWISFTDF